MQTNLAYLHDVLSYMIEGQYQECNPEYYVEYVQQYLDKVDQNRDTKNRNAFRSHLKENIKVILNNPNLDYDQIFFEGAMHGLGSQDSAKKVFELIWVCFFKDEGWHDAQFSSTDITLANEPFSG
jgi:hypothetical protein